jgi:hypothetical protein
MLHKKNPQVHIIFIMKKKNSNKGVSTKNLVIDLFWSHQQHIVFNNAVKAPPALHVCQWRALVRTKNHTLHFKLSISTLGYLIPKTMNQQEE